MYKKINLMLIVVSILTISIACNNSVEPEDEIVESGDDEIIIVADGDNHDDSGDYIWNNSEVIPIVLNENSIIGEGEGITIDGSKLTITSSGTYSLSGGLSNGQIIVNTEDEEIVRLILNGVDITCSNNAPIYVLSAKKTMLVLAGNTENFLTDGTSYILEYPEENEPNAAIFSKSDLTIYGDGTLTVQGNYNDGIASKDGLIVTTGNINVRSVDEGIRGKDYLIVKNGNITVESDGDGFKSNNVDDASLGYITIENGVINITAGGDAIDAEKDVEINSGNITLTSGGKGINSEISTAIEGGVLTINSGDDAIYSSGNVIINNGSIVISSDDDGIHADRDLLINGGDINITKSFEGIESADGDISINGGEIHIVSSDDGLNLAAGGDTEPGSSLAANYYLYINGGYIVIDANGDGIDANASVVMTNGDLIINGSTVSNNSALDYDGSFEMNGGFVVAVGSSKMAEAPGASSSQNSILVNFSSIQNAGYLVHIKNQTGEELLTFSPVKTYQSVAFSSSKLIMGSSYDVYLGGSSSGTATDGLYLDGTYSPGTKYTSFTISGTVTIVN